MKEIDKLRKIAGWAAVNHDARRAHRRRMARTMPTYLLSIAVFMALTVYFRTIGSWLWFVIGCLFTLKWAFLAAQELFPFPDIIDTQASQPEHSPDNT